jgi:DNA modification methylase
MKIECAHDELVDLVRLQPNPRNPNKHPQRQIEMLAKIIAYQGQRAPIVVSKRSGFIVKGHGRLEAIKHLGWAQAAVDHQDYTDEAQEFADMVADNKIAELAEHDDELMKLTALELNLDNGFDLDLLGVPELDLSMPDPSKDAIEDEVPEPTQSISKLGDLYELGEHRLLCGDSTAITDVEKLMNGEKADMVFTDPPYGMKLDTDYRSMGSKNNFKPVAGDGDDFKPELIQTLLGVFSYCDEVFLFGADYYAELIDGRNSGSWVVWDKRSHGEANIGTLDGSFGADFELCWSKSKHQRKMCRVIRNNGAFIKKREGVDTMHPTQKPVEMVGWFFEQWGKDRNNVADLFGGSGSTLIACEKTKRKCFMMELDPHYIDVIVSRWCKYSGKTSIKRNGEPMEWTI